MSEAPASEAFFVFKLLSFRPASQVEKSINFTSTCLGIMFAKINVLVIHMQS